MEMATRAGYSNGGAWSDCACYHAGGYARNDTDAGMAPCRKWYRRNGPSFPSAAVGRTFPAFYKRHSRSADWFTGDYSPISWGGGLDSVIRILLHCYRPLLADRSRQAEISEMGVGIV